MPSRRRPASPDAGRCGARGCCYGAVSCPSSDDRCRAPCAANSFFTSRRAFKAINATGILWPEPTSLPCAQFPAGAVTVLTRAPRWTIRDSRRSAIVQTSIESIPADAAPTARRHTRTVSRTMTWRRPESHARRLACVLQRKGMRYNAPARSISTESGKFVDSPQTSLTPVTSGLRATRSARSDTGPPDRGPARSATRRATAGSLYFQTAVSRRRVVAGSRSGCLKVAG